MAVDVVTATKNLIRIVVDASVAGAHDTGAGAPAAASLALENLGVTPFRPGQPFMVEIDATPAAASTTKLQGAPRYDPATGAKPVTGSSLWVDIVSITQASPLEQEVTPAADAYWLRPNVSATGAATVAFNIYPSGR